MGLTEYHVPHHYKMLLTSVGPTTESIQECLLEFARGATHNLSNLQLLVAHDGWSALSAADTSSRSKRIVNLVEESVIPRKWTYSYLGHILGRVNIIAANFAALDEHAGAQILDKADMILVPGGNTYQTLRGLKPHQQSIEQQIAQGKPYVSDSAGSIIAGLSTLPAQLKPADVRPAAMQPDNAFGFVDFDVVVHGPGSAHKIALPGWMARIASIGLSLCHTQESEIDTFIENRRLEGVSVEVLTDNEALSVDRGMIQRI